MSESNKKIWKSKEGCKQACLDETSFDCLSADSDDGLCILHNKSISDANVEKLYFENEMVNLWYHFERYNETQAKPM